MKILLIDDDVALCQTLGRALTEMGHLVECAGNGASGEHFARYSQFGLIILDLVLPDKDGVDVCHALRAGGVNTPILMLTGRGSQKEKVHGLDSGADDYLAKPFDYDELFARIRALQRRQSQNRSPVINISGVTVDTVSHEARRGGTPVELTVTEYRILEYLITNSDTLISQTMIMEHLWKEEKSPESNSIYVLIQRLRSKLGWDPHTGPIQTVRGCGYRLTL